MFRALKVVVDPAPDTVRRYGPLACLALLVPKVAWDIYIYKNSGLPESDEDENEDKSLLVATNKGVRALQQAEEALDVIKRICDETVTDVAWVESVLADIKPVVERFQSVTDKENREGKGKGKGGNAVDPEKKPTNVVNSMPWYPSVRRSLKYVLKEEAEQDSYLSQCEEAASEAKYSITLVLRSKPDEESKKQEEELRNTLKVLNWVLGILEVELNMQRMREAVHEFAAVDQFAAHLKKSMDDNEKPLEEILAKRMRLLVILQRFKWGNRYPPAPAQYFCMLVDPRSMVNAHQQHTYMWYDPFWGKRESITRRASKLHEREPVDHAKFDDIARAMVARYSSLLKQKDAATDTEQNQRFYKMLKFFAMIVGTRQQRSIMLVSLVVSCARTVVQTIETNFSTSIIVQAIVASGAVSGGGKMGRTMKLADVLSSIVVLRVASNLLGNLQERLQKSGQDSIRLGLGNMLTQHVLTQDLEDVGKKDRPDSPDRLISSISQQWEWDRGVGQLLLIPEKLFSQFSMLVSTALLLWSKSPQLTVSMIGVVVACDWLRTRLGRVEHWLESKLELDKQLRQGDVEYGVSQALGDFKTMRINVKVCLE
jgi:hypothetical protein